MKKKSFWTLLAGAFFAVISCQDNHSASTTEKIKVDDLETYFRKKLQVIDSTAVLDSFKLIRIDTITAKHRLSNEYRSAVKELEDATDVLADLLQDMKYNYSQASLASGLSAKLYRHYKTEGEEAKRKFEKQSLEIKEINLRSDSLLSAANLADSVSPVAFESVCLYQVRFANRSVGKDTAYIGLNLDYNIVAK